MFRASSCLSSGATTTAVAVSGLPSELGDSSAIGRGQAGRAMLLCSITHSIICTRLFRGKMHSDWFNGIEILQGRWQLGEKWDTVTPTDLKRLFVNGKYMSRWSRKV